jgi:flagellar protein FliS
VQGSGLPTPTGILAQEITLSGFANFGARAYASVGVETGVSVSTPHELILMLYDGALESLRLAIGCITANDPIGRAKAVSRAARIIDEGLRASLDHKSGGDLALQLDRLYDYMCRRILQGSTDNDAAPLEEIADMIDGLRSSWVAIEPGAHAAA